jgi:hypothetical protein
MEIIMATVQVQVQDGASTSATTVNDGGTVVNGGNIVDGNPMTVNKSLVDMADGLTDYGSKVRSQDGTSGDYAGVKAAAPGGTGGLAFFPNAQEGERNFLLRGVGTEDGNNKINNDASTILTVPGSEFASVGTRQVNTVHSLVDTRLLGSGVDTSFNVLARPSTDMVPGRTKGTGAGSDSNFVQVSDGSTAATDDAVNTDRGIPGELTYHFGGLAAPITDEYKARDSYES